MKIIFSNRRSLVVEVRPDQTVTVRAPKRTSKKELHRFIEKSASWIQKKLDYFSKRQEAAPRKQYEPAYIKQILETLYAKCWEQCKDWKYSMPRLRIRKMKTRWGSLSLKTMTVTLNSELIHLPAQCIEDVIMHELCHLKHQNHKKRFHKLLEKMAPSWRSRGYHFRRLV